MTADWKRALGTLAMVVVLVPAALAQISPAAGVDANSPSGPPSPMSEKDVWSVDPLTGALSVNIPFPTTPAGGRGPRVPFGLLYNSSSTFVLQSIGTFSTGGESQTGSAFESCYADDNCYYTASPTTTTPVTSTMHYGWTPPTYDPSSGPTGPWTTTGPYFVVNSETVPVQMFAVSLNGSPSTTIDEGSGCTVSGPYTYYDQAGAGHDMNLRTVAQIYSGSLGSTNKISPPCNFSSTSSPSTSVDGSMLMTSPGSILYPDGTKFTSSNGTAVLEDTNGNLAYLGQDSLGRSAFSTTIPIGQPGPIPVGTYAVTTTAATGDSQPYSVTVGTATIGTVNMPHPIIGSDPSKYEVDQLQYCIGSITCPTNYAVDIPTGTVNVVKSIALPNKTSYEFSYDPNYATIQEITFPTGGHVRFVWDTRNIGNRSIGATHVLSTIVVTDVYLATSSTSPESHWQYTYSDLASSSGPLQSSETAPDGTVTAFSGSPFYYSTLSYSPFQIGQFSPTWQETQRTITDSSQTMIQSVATVYSQGIAYGRPALVATSMYDGPSHIQKQTQFGYDSYGNVIEEDESDWYSCSGSPCSVPNGVGTAPPGGWVRRTYTTYAYQSPYMQSSAYSQALLTAHIVNKPSQVLVTDGSGIPYSLVQYRYDESAVSGSVGYANHDDKKYPAGVVTGRGNLTSEQHCALLSHASAVTPSSAASACPQSQWLKTTYTYDLAGQVTGKTDPLMNTTSYSYTDNYSEGTPLTPTDGYVNTITHPLGYVDQYSYSYSSGQITSHKDWNNQSTDYSYDDPGQMSRLQSVQYPDGGGYSVDYTDTSSPSVTITTTTGEASANIVRITQYDGLGRVSQTQLAANPNGAKVDTSYDADGRVYSVSNPYRSKQEATYGISVNSLYDALGRLKTKTDADGTSTVKYAYAGNSVTVTDENHNQWTKTSNGLGLMTAVKEPNGTSQSSVMETDYTYDPLGNLLSVQQWGGPNGTTSLNGPISRSFAYDSLSRLIAASNPENSSSSSPAALTCSGTTPGTKWTACYAYDGDGNLKLKTDNRGVSVQYSYDALNRLTSKLFLNDAAMTPLSCFQYGGPKDVQNFLAGRLTNAWTQYASSGNCTASPASNLYLTLRSVTAYDQVGRIKSELQCTPSNCSATHAYSVAMNYDLMGNLTSYTNGLSSTPGAGTSPLTFSETYDASGLLQSLTSSWNNQQLFSAQQPQANSCTDPNALFPYSAFGGLSGAAFGNGVTLVRGYDKRLRTICENDASGAGNAGAYSTGMITIKGVEQTK